MSQLPTCLALVFSDSIYVCPSTQKRTILGTFSAVFATEFPTRINVAVYCAFTDGMGKADLKIRLVRLSEVELEDEVIAVAGGELEFEDPRSVVELNLIFQGLGLPAAGEYRFQVAATLHGTPDCEEELLLERRLVAVQPDITTDADVNNEDTEE